MTYPTVVRCSNKFSGTFAERHAHINLSFIEVWAKSPMDTFKEAKIRVGSDNFWLVDGEASLTEDGLYTLLNWKPHRFEKDAVHVFYGHNGTLSTEDGLFPDKRPVMRLMPRHADVRVWDRLFVGKGGSHHHQGKVYGVRLRVQQGLIMLSTLDEWDGVGRGNFVRLRSSYPWAQAILTTAKSVVSGHQIAVRRAVFDYNIFVDADFSLDASAAEFFKPTVDYEKKYFKLAYVKNPLCESLVYGHGGPKSFSRKNLNTSIGPDQDMTMEQENLKVSQEIVGTHKFNWSEFSTFKTTLREVYKLSRSSDPEAQSRLSLWRQINPDARFAVSAALGLSEGLRLARYESFPINDGDEVWSHYLKLRPTYRSKLAS